jgi:glycogen operon protein
MHVDGFRFDLAAALARGLHAVDRLSAFFDIIHQDPVLSQVKLIAEPWDVGEGGYQVGNFPVLWAEWNGRYRDCARRFWRGDLGQVAELATRLTGSSDLYARNGRRPHASINFVTAHDGFTLRDLVSYNEKHNQGNGEGNRDGEDDNLSWNCGAEGETDDQEVQALRARQMRNMLTTLFASQGVPMLLHGDELGRTQGGNNNAYCQDNEIAWQSWAVTPEQRQFLAWTQRLLGLRKEYAVLRRRDYYVGRPLDTLGTKDIRWLRPDGGEMADDDWRDAGCRCLGVHKAVVQPDGATEPGASMRRESLLLLLNAAADRVGFLLPPVPAPWSWMSVLDTARPDVAVGTDRYASGATYDLESRSMAILTPAMTTTRP